VKECAVFGVDNEKLGELVCAFIVPEKGKEIKIPQLKSYLRKHLTSYQMPAYLKVVEEIPKNHLGKIARKDLKQFVDRGEIEKLSRVLGLLW
jgi:acyl-coenzyme A synthetase/AMP-(fatty) acid ligase